MSSDCKTERGLDRPGRLSLESMGIGELEGGIIVMITADVKTNRLQQKSSYLKMVER
jgi:hypothetical protein